MIIYHKVYEADAVGEHGTTEAELTALMSKLGEDWSKLLAEKNCRLHAFAYDEETLKLVTNLANRQRAPKFDCFGHWWIHLGARAVMAALTSPFHNFCLINLVCGCFLGGNTDPQEIADVLEASWIQSKTAINIISKSG